MAKPPILSDDAMAMMAMGGASFAQTLALMTPKQRRFVGQKLHELAEIVLAGADMEGGGMASAPPRLAGGKPGRRQ